MKGLMFIAFVITALSLGYELYTGDAFLKGGGGSISEEPRKFYTKVTFEIVICLMLLVGMFLPEEKINKLNEWLKQFDSKYDKEE